MGEQNILCATTRAEFRAWLESHHHTEKECWVDVRRGRPADDSQFWYLDADRYQKGDLPLSNMLSKYCSYIAS